MKEYECFMNGQKIVISNNLDIIPNDWKVKDVLKNKPVEGSLDFDIKLNPLWNVSRKQVFREEYICRFCVISN